MRSCPFAALAICVGWRLGLRLAVRVMRPLYLWPVCGFFSDPLRRDAGPVRLVVFRRKADELWAGEGNRAARRGGPLLRVLGARLQFTRVELRRVPRRLQGVEEPQDNRLARGLPKGAHRRRLVEELLEEVLHHR